MISKHSLRRTATSKKSSLRMTVLLSLGELCAHPAFHWSATTVSRSRDEINTEQYGHTTDIVSRYFYLEADAPVFQQVSGSTGAFPRCGLSSPPHNVNQLP